MKKSNVRWANTRLLVAMFGTIAGLIAMSGIQAMAQTCNSIELPFPEGTCVQVPSQETSVFHANDALYALDFNGLLGGNTDCGLPVITATGGKVVESTCIDFKKRGKDTAVI
jgi:hypothetical protein